MVTRGIAPLTRRSTLSTPSVPQIDTLADGLGDALVLTVLEDGVDDDANDDDISEDETMIAEDDEISEDEETTPEDDEEGPGEEGTASEDDGGGSEDEETIPDDDEEPEDNADKVELIAVELLPSLEEELLTVAGLLELFEDVRFRLDDLDLDEVCDEDFDGLIEVDFTDVARQVFVGRLEIELDFAVGLLGSQIPNSS